MILFCNARFFPQWLSLLKSSSLACCLFWGRQGRGTGNRNIQNDIYFLFHLRFDILIPKGGGCCLLSGFDRLGTCGIFLGKIVCVSIDVGLCSGSDVNSGLKLECVLLRKFGEPEN